jgi:hypothetical protein
MQPPYGGTGEQQSRGQAGIYWYNQPISLILKRFYWERRSSQQPNDAIKLAKPDKPQRKMDKTEVGKLSLAIL